jgi:hypothetical protein
MAKQKIPTNNPGSGLPTPQLLTDDERNIIRAILHYHAAKALMDLHSHEVDEWRKWAMEAVERAKKIETLIDCLKG